MRTKLRLTALAVGFAGLVFWFFGGPNLGWTKTSVTHMQKDSVTEIEYPVIEKKFIPGIDFLGVCVVGAGLLWSVSFLFRRK